MPPSIPSRNETPDAFGPTVGANCRGVATVGRIRGAIATVEMWGVRREGSDDGIAHNLSSFGSCNGGEILRAAITHYKAIWVCQLTMRDCSELLTPRLLS